MKRLFGRPSPAAVIAMVALLAALSGTAVGATVLTKKKVKKISNNQITKRAPSLSVASAKTADSATTADNAQPTAFAQVSAAGTLNPGNSKNVGSVTLSHTSFYCFKGLSFTPRGIQANLDFNDASNGTVRVGLGDANGFCPAGTEAFVNTLQGGTSTPYGFFVLFYG